MMSFEIIKLRAFHNYNIPKVKVFTLECYNYEKLNVLMSICIPDETSFSDLSFACRYSLCKCVFEIIGGMD